MFLIISDVIYWSSPRYVRLERPGARVRRRPTRCWPGQRPARIDLAEHWAPDGDRFEQIGYRYELLDHRGDRRRAFHRHDDVVFLRAFGVAVHEHCEEPIGMAPCEHVAGLPKRDGFEALNDLLVAWSTSSDRSICAELHCLE